MDTTTHESIEETRSHILEHFIPMTIVMDSPLSENPEVDRLTSLW